MNLKIIDNFYKKEDFDFMSTATMLNPYRTYWQPNGNFFIGKTNVYPCYETTEFLNDSQLFNIFINTFQEKSGILIENVTTFFRKIYSNELEHVFKYGLRPHKDEVNGDIAGVIYYNTFSLHDGTGIFSGMDVNKDQIEPDIIIGAKPNRCVYYDPNIWHRPLQDKNTEMRIVQPFFIKIKKYENN